MLPDTDNGHYDLLLANPALWTCGAVGKNRKPVADAQEPPIDNYEPDLPCLGCFAGRCRVQHI